MGLGLPTFNFSISGCEAARAERDGFLQEGMFPSPTARGTGGAL